MNNNDKKENTFIKQDTLKKLVGRYGNKDVVSQIESSTSINQVTNINVASLTLFPLLSESNYTDESLEVLSRSIVKDGIIIPVFVYQYQSKLMVVNGVKRFLIAKRAGFTTVPCVELKASLEDIIIYILNNMLSNKDNPLVQATVYNALLNDFNMSEKDIRKITSLSHGQIANMLRLLKLSSKVKKMILSEEISYAKARLLVSLPEKEQEKVAKEIENLSVRDCESYVRNYKSNTPIEEKDEVVNYDYKVEGNKVEITVNSSELMDKLIEFLEKNN